MTYFLLRKTNKGILKFHSRPKETYVQFLKRVTNGYPKHAKGIVEVFASDTLTLWHFYNHF
jgi:hypothetical protein